MLVTLVRNLPSLSTSTLNMDRPSQFLSPSSLVNSPLLMIVISYHVISMRKKFPLYPNCICTSMCCYKFLSVCHPRFLFSCVDVHVYFDKIHLCICRSLLLNASFISTSLIWIGNLCYDDNIYIYKHMYRHIAVYLIECTCTCTCNPVSSVFDKLI